MAQGYDVLEDDGGAVGVSGGGTTVGVCVGLCVGVCVGLSVGVCVGLSVGVTTAVGVLVTVTVVVLLELHPVIAAAMTAAPQPIRQIILALLIFSPPGVYRSCDLLPHSRFRTGALAGEMSSQLSCSTRMEPVSAGSGSQSIGRFPSRLDPGALIPGQGCHV